MDYERLMRAPARQPMPDERGRHWPASLHRWDDRAPKGVMLSHANLMVSAMAADCTVTFGEVDRGRCSAPGHLSEFTVRQPPPSRDHQVGRD